MPVERSVINIIGQAGSGKSTVAHYLHEKHGFEIYRPSDTIRQYASAQGIPLIGRDTYVKCHREMIDADPFAMTRPVVNSDAPRICVDGLRVRAHVEELKQRCGMFTAALVCPAEIRFEHVMNAGEWRSYRDETHLQTLADFIADEQADNHNTDPIEPNVEAIMDMADVTINGNRPLYEVLADVDRFIIPLLGSQH